MNIKDWYIQKYPEDEMGKELNANVGIKECWQMMKNGNDFYTIVNGADSIVRERVFSEIARIHGIDYDVVYNVWLNNEA